MKKIILYFLCLNLLRHDLSAEEKCLKNIRQLTFADMGFEKAGEAYFSPDSTEIIFQAVPFGETEYQIFTLKIGETTPKMVSTGLGSCTCAFYRPDGKKIIFASSHENVNITNTIEKNGKYVWHLTPYMNIYEANPDGTELKKLTFGPAYHAECAYSPDGKEIVYASNETGSMNLYIMNSDGTNSRQLTFTNYSYNGGPFFSPDGKSVIFRSDRKKKDFLQIFMIDLFGNEKMLTDLPCVNWAPFWHPNGKVVAFTTSLHGHHRYEIYLLHIDSSTLYRVTDHEGFDGLPTFNSTGDKIMWTSKRGDGSCQIFLADFELPEEITDLEKPQNEKKN